eukprot:6214514-Pleurochrysis_carterae.AAC.8
MSAIQYASRRYSKRPAKFQKHGSSGRGALPTCGLDNKCCNDAIQAGLGQNDLRLNLYVEFRKMVKSNRSVAQRVLSIEVEADHHRRYTV